MSPKASSLRKSKSLIAPETLEQRRLNAGLTPHPLFAPDTPASYVARFDASYNAASFGQRWSATAVNGKGLKMGDPTTITWSIVPDGTPIPGFDHEAAAPSDLVARLSSIYGTNTPDARFEDEPWFDELSWAFARWSVETGIEFRYEPRDDGRQFSNNPDDAPGRIGVRGDMRLGGHRIDGDSRVLAYNFYPDNGEMVIDTADAFYSSLENDSVRLRNVVAHEIGHGIGLHHVNPLNQTKLMEPRFSSAFEGPRYDDIREAQRRYGDDAEPNDSRGQARSLGRTTGAGVGITNVSIDGATDVDFFRIDVTQAGALAAVLEPTGDVYLRDVDGAIVPFDSKSQNNLSLAMIDGQGNVIASAAANPAGSSESLVGIHVSIPGVYFVRVSGTFDAAQTYSLRVAPDMTLSVPRATIANRLVNAVDVNFHGVNLNATSRLELEVTRENGARETTSLAPDRLGFRISGLVDYEPVTIRVRAVGASGESAWSSPVALVGRPMLTIENSYLNAVDLKWTTARNASSFEVVVRNAGVIVARQRLGADATKLRVQGLQRGTTYDFEVIAIGIGAGNSLSSGRLSAKTKR